MDYTYIEQLLEKYFACETSCAEEQILHAFFAQENVPVHLLSYRELFTESARCHEEETLGSDFDARLLAAISSEEHKEPVKVKAKVVTMQRRLRPLYKAAACVAVVLALGQAAQMPYTESEKAQENVAVAHPQMQKEENAVAKSDSVTKSEKTVEVPVAN